MTRSITYEVSLQLKKPKPASLELLRQILFAHDIAPTDLVEKEDRSFVKLSVYYRDRSQAQGLARRLRLLKMTGVRVLCQAHQQKDWESRWKEGWKPFSLTRRFHMIPLWQKNRFCPRGKDPVFLDTNNAFGTGLHETTRFTAQLIQKVAPGQRSFLDIGTGSGILTIVAAKSGVREYQGFDFDAGAVLVAKSNLKANKLLPDTIFQADIHKWRPRRTFDLVAANLITQDLLAFRENIVAAVRPGGWLIVSGVSLKKFTSFLRGFGVTPLRLQKTLKGREWTAMLFRKSED